MPSYRSTSIEIGNAPTCTRRPRNLSSLSEPAASVNRRADLEKFWARELGLEAEHVRSQHRLEDLLPPRDLREQLLRRERDVQEEPDLRVRHLLAQHPGHQLQLVVVHPDQVVRARDLHRRVREALVDLHVGPPPAAVEVGLADRVVVEGPERLVAEPRVEVLELAPDIDTGLDPDVLVLERLASPCGRRPVPADPAPAPLAEHGRQRRHQPAGARLPLARALLDPAHRHPVRHHDQALAPLALDGVFFEVFFVEVFFATTGA
jgi:hypothetical protein